MMRGGGGGTRRGRRHKARQRRPPSRSGKNSVGDQSSQRIDIVHSLLLTDHRLTDQLQSSA